MLSWYPSAPVLNLFQMKKTKTASKTFIDLSWYAPLLIWVYFQFVLTKRKACDDVLKSVEISLTNFQKDLGAVSAEIETLQSRSTALNTKLENRRVVEKLLGPAVEEISISPAVITKLCESPIDHAWAKALEEVEKRSKTIDNKLRGPDDILAAADLKPILEDLTNLVLDPCSFSIAQG